MLPTKSTKTLAVTFASLILVAGALYYFFWFGNYDKALLETSIRINSLANIELNIDNAGDITYADLEKKIEQYISESDALYTKTGADIGIADENEKIVIAYLSASMKFQRAMKLRYETQWLANSVSKRAKEAANNRMNTPYYMGGDPMVALSAFNASTGAIMQQLSEARNAEESANNAEQSFFAATKLLIAAAQKAKTMTNQSNLVNFQLLEKIYSRAK